MNIYKLITPVNKYNYVNHPYIKRDFDYYCQHTDNTNADGEFDFMKRKKLSTNIYGCTYNDNYLIPKIRVISNAMKVEIQDRTPLSKRVPEVMKNPYTPFGDPNTKYDELLSASQQMLSTVEPINYFGCRIVGNYLYNFDIGMIFKIIPKDFLARFIDKSLIKESTVYVDSRSAMIMPQKSAFKNIWIDTKKYIPVNPKYVETIDINSLIQQSENTEPLGVNLNEQSPYSYYATPLHVEPVTEQPIAEQPIEQTPVRQPIEPVRQVVEQPVEPVRQPVEPVRQPVEQPVSRNIPIGEIPPLPFDQSLIELPDEKSSMNKPSRAYRRSNKRKQQSEKL